MIRLLQRSRSSPRSELNGIRRVLRCLKLAPPGIRFAVGAGIGLANSDFMGRFAGLQTFRQVSNEAQRRFYSDLSDLELNLRNLEPGMALGVGLYRIWLTGVLAGKRNAAELLGEELTELSRKASCALTPLSGD